jgi:hypothetical protein
MLPKTLISNIIKSDQQYSFDLAGSEDLKNENKSTLIMTKWGHQLARGYYIITVPILHEARHANEIEIKW